MDSVDLLAKEEEFKKLNRQLEKKSNYLIKEIENAMQKQDIFSEFSPGLIMNNHYLRKQKNIESPPKTSPKVTPKRIATQKKPKTKENIDSKITFSEPECSEIEEPTSIESVKVVCEFCSTHNRNEESYEFLQAFVGVNVKTGVLPKSFLKETITVESVCKFLASKVKLIDEQIVKLQSVIDKKVSQCEAHMTQLADYESDRLKLMTTANSLKADSTELRAKVQAVQNRLDEKDRLYKEQRSETDRLTSEVKRIRSKHASSEAKCVALEEEVERAKLVIDNMKVFEKDLKSSLRSATSSHNNLTAQLEKKVKFLLKTIDKQKCLIDNLKKQNSLLSLDLSVKCLEKDYVEFLNK